MPQIRVPFSVDANGRIAVTSTDAEVDRQNLQALLNTQPGERAMRPTYGVATRSLIFENADMAMADSVTAEIDAAVATYAPEIELVDTQIQNARDQAFNEGRLSVAVVYRPAAGRLDTGYDQVTTTLEAGG